MSRGTDGHCTRGLSLTAKSFVYTYITSIPIISRSVGLGDLRSTKRRGSLLTRERVLIAINATICEYSHVLCMYVVSVFRGWRSGLSEG